MNRWTFRNNGIAYPKSELFIKHNLMSKIKPDEDYEKLISELAERVAAYEDTGFEPEQVKQLNDAFKNSQKKLEKAFDDLLAYKDLEEQGLLIKLPCKVGDRVYVNANTIGTYDDIAYAEAEVISIRITKKQTFVKLRIFALDFEGMPYGCKNYSVSSFGKTVFLTEREIKKALEDK